jgi:hypothetical protein
VVVESPTPVTCRALRVQFIGKEKTKFTITKWEGKSSGAAKGSMHHKRRERVHDQQYAHVHYTMTLWGNPESGLGIPNSQLTAGTHRFPFEFQVPAALLGSFEWKKSYSTSEARIRYKLKAYLDIAMGRDIVDVIPIQVYSPITALQRQPFDALRTQQVSKSICLSWFSKGDIQVILVFRYCVVLSIKCSITRSNHGA